MKSDPFVDDLSVVFCFCLKYILNLFFQNWWVFYEIFIDFSVDDLLKKKHTFRDTPFMSSYTEPGMEILVIFHLFLVVRLLIDVVRN